MISLGFMTLSKKSENKYFSEVAKRSQRLGIQCYRFVPTDINPLDEMVSGEKYDLETGEWIASTFQIPTFLYDRCFYSDSSHSKRCKPIVGWLKNRPNTFFLGHGLPNKWVLFNTLKESHDLSPYLPETHLITSEQDVTDYIKNHRKIIIKPINGSQGYNLFSIRKTQEGILVGIDKKAKHASHLFTTVASFQKWLASVLEKNTMLLQPNLNLMNEEDRPFDIRVLLQKNDGAHWEQNGIGIRVGKQEYITSNLSNGAEVITYDDWITTYPRSFKHYFSSELQHLLAKLPLILDSAFSPIFEVGVDIGISKDHKIWILDINSKPGRKVALRAQPEHTENIYNAPLQYCRYLNNIKRKERSK